MISFRGKPHVCGPASHSRAGDKAWGAGFRHTSGLKSRLGHLEALCLGHTSVSSSLEWEEYTHYALDPKSLSTVPGTGY